MEPPKSVICLFHQVIVSRGSLLRDSFWWIAQGCVGVKELLEAKGRKKGNWGGQDYLDNCLNLLTVNIAEKHEWFGKEGTQRGVRCGDRL